MIRSHELDNRMVESSPRRRGGRPPVANEQTEPVTTRVPRTLYDASYRYGREHGINLAEVVRQALRKLVVR